MRPSTNPYFRIFSVPGAVAFSSAGFLARMAHLMTVLSIVFLVSARTGSYGQAGVVAAAYALTYSLASPLVSQLVDRKRQGWVLGPAAAANALTRMLFLAAALLNAPTWLLLVCSALSGATMPPVGPLVRARWGFLLRGQPTLNTALSFESVLDQLINTVGPILVSMLAAYLNPASGVVIALVLATAGLALLAPQRRTEPAAVPRHGAKGGTALSAPGFVPLVATFIAMGAAGNTISIVTVAFCQEHGAKALSGWILAAVAVGSGVSGFWYGVREWSTPPQRRLVFSLVLLLAGTLLFVATPQVWLLFVAAFGYGLTASPTMIAGFSVVNRFVPERQLTEGLTWITASVGLGISIASSVSGVAIDSWGPARAYLLATVWAALAVLAGLLMLAAQRWTARHHPTPAPAAANEAPP